jgi:hypothetical protein
VLPASSEAVAVYVCVPSATEVKVVCHAPPEPAVTVATRVAPSNSLTTAFDSAVPDTATEELVSVLLSDGLKIVGASGATVSTVHDRVAGDWSAFPAPSVARTAKSCAPCESPV